MKYDFDNPQADKANINLTKLDLGNANSTAQTVKKQPFDATALGTAINTARVIPSSTTQVGKNILRESARVIGSVGVSLAKPLGGEQELSPESFSSPLGQSLYETVFGFKPVKSLEDRIADTDIAIKFSPTAKSIGLDKFSLPLAFGGVIGEATLELTGLGSSKNLAKNLLKETTEEGVIKLLKGADPEVVKMVAPMFAKADSPAKVDAVMNLFQSTLGTKVLANKAPQTLKTAPQQVVEYSVIHQGGVIKKVQGEPVKILDGVDTFLHTDENGNWAVSEATTGRNITGGGFENKNFAIKAAKENLDSIDKTELQRMITENQLPPTKQAVANVPSVEETPSSALMPGEAKSIEIQAEQARNITKGGDFPMGVSLPKIISETVTPVEKKVHVIDTYLRTPNRVMEKIGFGKEAKDLRVAGDEYWKELPKNIDKIKNWAKEVPAESNKRIFKWLDGQAIDLRPEEQKVANEVKTWLQGWAERLKIQNDNRISEYITHVFDKGSQKEFDEELAKLIADKIPGSVYDPFTLKRLGARGYKEDTWLALDAYVKRGTRKVHFDPVLEKIQRKAGSALDMSNIEKSQWKYINNYISNINMRPTDLDESVDNVVKNIVGYKFGTRPVTRITALLRRMTFRGMLGLNPGSALRNISQGINTYATLGEKYTTIGYVSLLKRGATSELEREGVLNAGFIQDKVLSVAGKAMEKLDKGLFYFFDKAEKINRGSAYFGAKSKALAEGKTEEQAIEYAKGIVRKTQFVFDTVDTPVGMGSDIVKTLTQFQTFTTKQIEFLTEMARDKNFVGLLRYGVAGMLFVSTIGKAFGMEPKELLPIYRLGTPPALKFPVEVGKAVLDTPNKYGQQRSLGQKASDIGKATVGLIPGGTQAKKTIQGVTAVGEGAVKDKAGRTQFKIGSSTWNNIQAYLFGKYASPEAKAYFDKKENPTKKEGETKKKKTYSF